MAGKKGRAGDARGVSDAELRVLEQLWEGGPAGPSELRERLEADGVDWAYTTVQTLLHRLHDKGYVSRERAGKQQLYRAELASDELLYEQMSDLTERLGSSAESSMILNLVRGKRLTKRDLGRLRDLLDSAEANRGRLPEA